jgi:hypothetical protein
MILLTLIGFMTFGTLFWLLKRRDAPPPPPPEPINVAKMTLFQTLRRVLGWIFIVLGILLFWLPLPLGIPFMMLGAALIGRRDRTLRRMSVNVRLLLRRWAKLPIPIIGPIGRRLLYMQQHMSRELRRWRWKRMGLM